jgi:hypothetical protein
MIYIRQATLCRIRLFTSMNLMCPMPSTLSNDFQFVIVISNNASITIHGKVNFLFCVCWSIQGHRLVVMYWSNHSKATRFWSQSVTRHMIQFRKKKRKKRRKRYTRVKSNTNDYQMQALSIGPTIISIYFSRIQQCDLYKVTLLLFHRV